MTERLPSIRRRENRVRQITLIANCPLRDTIIGHSKPDNVSSTLGKTQ
tara:strand:- start:104 stop:247 length:144 start_codon:yes stop_codon:yes gene_type:complete